MLDENDEYAVLRYSRGEVGQRLIQINHRLAVGSDSVIGRVTARKRPGIVNDTYNVEDEGYTPNPLLPETRAEMGLPLHHW